MSIPGDSQWRGASSCVAQPPSNTEVLKAQSLCENVRNYNCSGGPNLPEIAYRESSNDYDIVHHTFRWDTRPYAEIFERGFQPWREQNQTDEEYYSLERYINTQGKLNLDPIDNSSSVFVAATRAIRWHPTLAARGTQEIYRYEIYAPGGIDVTLTFQNRHSFNTDEVWFVGGIHSNYIRSAQLYKLTRFLGSNETNSRRHKEEIYLNTHFNPHSTTDLQLHRPTGCRLKQVPYPPLQIPADHYYFRQVCDSEKYVSGAFTSVRQNEAYFFFADEYVLINYAPTADRIVNGPLKICKGYPSLAATVFANDGVDCAFQSHHKPNEAFLFHGNQFVLLNYAPGTTDDYIIEGPLKIADGFPCLKGTVFERGIDAAFCSTVKNEVYIFRGDVFARINCAPNAVDSNLVDVVKRICDGFRSLRGTVFADGIDMGFSSHRPNEAYLFKGEWVVRLNFAPGPADNDFLIGNVKKITDCFPSLKGIVPWTGCDCDDRAATTKTRKAALMNHKAIISVCKCMGGN